MTDLPAQTLRRLVEDVEIDYNGYGWRLNCEDDSAGIVEQITAHFLPAHERWLQRRQAQEEEAARRAAERQEAEAERQRAIQQDIAAQWGLRMPDDA